MATVTKAIVERHNESAAPMDKVNGRDLEARVRRKEGKDIKITNRDNNKQEQQVGSNQTPAELEEISTNLEYTSEFGTLGFKIRKSGVKKMYLFQWNI